MFKQLLLITQLISSITLKYVDDSQFDNVAFSSHTDISNVSLTNTSWDTTNIPSLVARNSNTNKNEIQVDVQILNTNTSYIEYDLIFDGFYNENLPTDVQNVLVSVQIVTDKYEDTLSLQTQRQDGTIPSDGTGITLTDSEQIYSYNLYGKILEKSSTTSNRLNFISHDVYGSVPLDSVLMKFSFNFTRSSTTNTTIRITHFIDVYDSKDVLRPVYSLGFQEGYTDGSEDGYQEGYTDGYEEGEYVANDSLEQAYHNGLEDGYEVGFEEGKISKNPFGGFFEILESATASMHNFFSIEVLPNLTLSTILGIFIVLPLFIFFLKLISAK